MRYTQEIQDIAEGCAIFLALIGIFVTAVILWGWVIAIFGIGVYIIGWLSLREILKAVLVARVLKK